MSLKRKLTKFTKTYDNSPVTIEALVKVLNSSKGTLYNNKKLLEEFGIVLEHGNKGTPSRTTPKLKITNSDASEIAITKTLFKQTVNYVCTKLCIPYIYSSTAEHLCKSVSSSLTLSSAKVFLSRCEKTPKFLTPKEMWDVAEVLNELEHTVRCTLEPQERADILSIFEEKLLLSPSEEQLRAVALMAKTLLKGGSGYKYVQAVAGSSKTTCINATRLYLKQYHNMSVPVLTLTNKAASMLNGSSTVHSMLQRLLGIQVLDCSEELLASYTDLGLFRGTLEPMPALIVDEYTTLPGTLVRILKTLGKNVIFVGDKAQISRNSEFVGTRLCSLTHQYRFDHSLTNAQVRMTTAHFERNYEEMCRILDEKCVGTFTGKLKKRNVGNRLENYTDYKDSFNDFVEVFDKYKSLDSCVIAYSSNACEVINYIMNGHSKEFKNGSKISLRVTKYVPSEVVSGSQGIVLKTVQDGYEVMVGGTRFVATAEELELSYAITTLKSQGSSWDYVLFVAGTSNREAKHTDMYVGATRAKLDFEVLKRDSVDSSQKDADKLLVLGEGSRNTSLFEGGKALKEVIEASGYSVEEAYATIGRSFGTESKTKTTLTKSNIKETTLVSPSNQDNTWSYTLMSPEGRRIPAKSEDKNKTEAQAKYALDMYLKSHPSYTGFLTRNLKGTGVVVLDCDCKAAVDHFKHLSAITKSCISANGEKAHFYFKTDKVLNTMHKNDKGVDFLGNAEEQNVDVKPNKEFNDLAPAALTDEIFNSIKSYMK